MSEEVLIAIGGGFLTVIGWFLSKIYKSFEETKNDVKQLLINGGKRDEEIENIHQNIGSIKGDIHTLVMNHAHFDKRLQEVEQTIEIIKLKK